MQVWLIPAMLLVAVPTKKSDRKPPPIASALQSIAEGKRSCKALRVHYKDGSDSLGWTSVDVKNARATITRQNVGEPAQIYQGKLPDTLCRRMAAKALSGRLWKVRPTKRAGGANETRPSVEIGVGSMGGIKIAILDNDVQNKPAFAILRGQLLILARQISGNTVRY